MRRLLGLLALAAGARLSPGVLLNGPPLGRPALPPAAPRPAGPEPAPELWACRPGVAHFRLLHLRALWELAGLASQSPKQRLERAFAEGDADLSLLLTPGELEVMAEQAGCALADAPKVAAQLLLALDANRDGALGYAEWAHHTVCDLRHTLYTERWFDEVGYYAVSTRVAAKPVFALGPVSRQAFDVDAEGFGLDARNTMQLFDALDQNADGVLGRGELAALGGLPLWRSRELRAHHDLPSRFYAFGGLSVEASLQRVSEWASRQAFAKADSDEDQRLGEDEVASLASDLGLAAGASRSRRALDRDADGWLSPDEYVNACAKLTKGRCAHGLLDLLAAPCEPWRGPTLCNADASCECLPGFCAKDGVCIPEELHSPLDVAGDSTHADVLLREASGLLNARSNAELPQVIAIGSIIVLLFLNQIENALKKLPTFALLCMFTIAVCYTWIAVPLLFQSVTFSQASDFWILAMLLQSVLASMFASLLLLAPVDAVPLGLVLSLRQRSPPRSGSRALYLLYVGCFFVSFVSAAGMAVYPQHGMDETQKTMLVGMYVILQVTAHWTIRDYFAEVEGRVGEGFVEATAEARELEHFRTKVRRLPWIDNAKFKLLHFLCSLVALTLTVQLYVGTRQGLDTNLDGRVNDAEDYFGASWWPEIGLVLPVLFSSISLCVPLALVEAVERTLARAVATARPRQ